jgi:hypothetical protein
MVTHGDVTSPSTFVVTATKQRSGCTAGMTSTQTRIGLVIGLLLAVTVSGCAKPSGNNGIATAGSASAKASSSAPADNLSPQERAAKFGDCVRSNGVPDFSDPETEGGGFMMKAPDGVDPQKMDAAMQKCKQYLPNGGEPPKMDAAQLEQMRQYAKCMRENGIPNFPDPDPNGGFQIDLGKLGVTPDDPKFKAAQETCKKFQPAPPSGAPTQRSDG